MEYITRFIGGKPFKFQKCPRCGKAVGHDCHCEKDDDGGKWLIPWLIICLLIGMAALFYAANADAQWYDEQRLKYTPATTIRHKRGQVDVIPANLFVRGDTVDCVMIDLDGNIHDQVFAKLSWRRIVTFHSMAAYENGVLAYCKQK